MSTALIRRLAKDDAAREQRDIAQGKRFAVAWFYDTRRYGPIRYASLEEAEAKRDAMIAKNERPIPDGYYDGDGALVTMAVWIEVYDGREWRALDGSERSAVVGVV